MSLYRQVIFNDGSQHTEQVFIALFFFRAVGNDCLRATFDQKIKKTAHAVHVRFHPQQVPAYIRVADNRHRGCAVIGKIFKVPALNPFPGIIDCQKIGRRSIAQSLQTGAHPGMVDHVEHNFHAPAFFSEQVADAFSFASQSHAAGGAAVDAVFFFNPAADNIVAVAEAAVFVDKVLGNQKKGNSFCSPWEGSNPVIRRSA